MNVPAPPPDWYGTVPIPVQRQDDIDGRNGRSGPPPPTGTQLHRSGGHSSRPDSPRPESWLLIVGGVVVLLLMIGIVRSGRDAENSTANQATAYTAAAATSSQPTTSAPASVPAPAAAPTAVGAPPAALPPALVIAAPVAPAPITVAPAPAPAPVVAAPAAPAAPVPVTTPPAPPAPAPVVDAPAAPASPIVYQGQGDDVLHIAKPDGVAILLFECPRCVDNTIVKSDGAEGLLVNTIGAYSGKTWLDAENGSRTSQLVINATGAWKATVGSVAALARRSNGSSISGRGDDVVVMDGSSTAAAITNRGGDDNFVVWVLADGDRELPVNTIGGYRGTVQLAAPALVEVTSDGSWTITPRA